MPEREIIGLDLRNHGASPHVSCGMRYEDMAADVIAFLDREGIERACLVGHSMGGKVCMQLALTEPHRVSELCVVDIAPVGYTPGLDSGDPSTTTNAMLAVDLDACKTRNDIDARLKDTGIRSETVRQFVMANLVPREDDRTRYRWRCNLPQINASFGHIMAFPDTRGRVFEGPTCLIRGGKSKYVPFSTMRGFTALFPKSRLLTFSDAGHWLQAEQPEAFSRAVTDWLKDVETSKHSGRRDI